jgi:hypothetical protein
MVTKYVWPASSRALAGCATLPSARSSWSFAVHGRREPAEGLQGAIRTAPFMDRPLVVLRTDFRLETRPLESRTLRVMTIAVAINEPRLLAGLAQSLELHSCAVRGLSDRALEITSVDNRGVSDARLEVQFFLRAWQNAHPGVELLIS